MKKFSFYSMMLLSAALLLLLNACSKSSDGPGTTPEPKPEPPVTTTLNFPKKEMRAAWVATVWGIDWPTSKEMVAQKKQYTDLLDRLKSLKFNTVFVQVRGMGDAFYNSPYEPWSGNITGTRGKDPGYDVMKFMIDEAHARGIEFHAWINPYRIATRASTGSTYPALHSSVKPEWVVDHERFRFITQLCQKLDNVLRIL